MLSVRLALGVAASFALAGPSQAEADPVGQAWFVQDSETKQWCGFVDEAGARTAADDERFDWSESARLTYGTDGPVTLLVALQSEDAYVEDTYSFAADLTLIQVVRRGHYIEEPYFAATYRPGRAGQLRLTAESAEASRNWARRHETYFLDWHMYRSFAELPYAPLIETKPRISVAANCGGLTARQ